MGDTNDDNNNRTTKERPNKTTKKKKGKGGIIYLSEIPQTYKNKKKLQEFFQYFGEIRHVHVVKKGDGSKTLEGWVEFDKKVRAKKVATKVNNSRVTMNKKSIDSGRFWNIKYLSGFKWEHLMLRLNYEKEHKKGRKNAELMIASKKAEIFADNLNKWSGHNREYDRVNFGIAKLVDEETGKDRNKFLSSLFN